MGVSWRVQVFICVLDAMEDGRLARPAGRGRPASITRSVETVSDANGSAHRSLPKTETRRAESSPARWRVYSGGRDLPDNTAGDKSAESKPGETLPASYSKT